MEMLTMGEGLNPPFIADIICEQALICVGDLFFTLYSIAVIKLCSNLSLINNVINYWKPSLYGKSQ